MALRGGVGAYHWGSSPAEKFLSNLHVTDVTCERGSTDVTGVELRTDDETIRIRTRHQGTHKQSIIKIMYSTGGFTTIDLNAIEAENRARNRTYLLPYYIAMKEVILPSRKLFIPLLTATRISKKLCEVREEYTKMCIDVNKIF